MKPWIKIIAVGAAGAAATYGIVRAVRHHRAATIGGEPGSSLDNPIQTQADNPLGADDLESLGEPAIVTEEVIVITELPVVERR